MLTQFDSYYCIKVWISGTPLCPAQQSVNCRSKFHSQFAVFPTLTAQRLCSSDSSLSTFVSLPLSLSLSLCLSFRHFWQDTGGHSLISPQDSCPNKTLHSLWPLEGGRPSSIHSQSQLVHFWNWPRSLLTLCFTLWLNEYVLVSTLHTNSSYVMLYSDHFMNRQRLILKICTN